MSEFHSLSSMPSIASPSMSDGDGDGDMNPTSKRAHVANDKEEYPSLLLPLKIDQSSQPRILPSANWFVKLIERSVIVNYF